MSKIDYFSENTTDAMIEVAEKEQAVVEHMKLFDKALVYAATDHGTKDVRTAVLASARKLAGLS